MLLTTWAVYADLASLDGIKSNDHAQKRGFSAAGGTKKRKELAGTNVHRQSVDDGMVTVTLDDMINFNGNAHADTSIQALKAF